MKRICILLTIISVVIITIIITTKINNNFEKDQVITFSIANDTVSHHVYNDHFLALTKDGNLYVYDKSGKQMKTNQTDLRFIGTYGDLLFIKNDGSIISNINEDTYEGTEIGKIPGAVSGCRCHMTVIVTDKGELYFKDREGGSPFKFRDSEQYDGWTKINDIKDVDKAVLISDSLSGELMVLNKKGEVYCISDDYSYGKNKFINISKNYIITDISQCNDVFLLLDNQGYLYAYGRDERGWYVHLYDHITKIECFKNIERLWTSYSQGAVITVDQDTFVWQKEEISEGKSHAWRMHFGELREQEWDEIVMASSDYIYTIKDEVVTRIPTHTMCDKVDTW